ncbi:MAG TPA: choice-of-anchor A family protein [Tepidisphaeraceae bacterium]|jgi:choice-of-anchor A domain-containing protein|nr:choice-of-anchor A family protein [Tepidisphaeraceae bacterium]
MAGRILLCAAGLSLAGLGASLVRADTLGVANDYNVFVLGDMSMSNVDAGGKVAVAGNATFNNYTINGSSSSTNLIVNGNFTKTGGGTLNGNVLVNGNANISNPTITGKLEVNGSTYINPNGGGSVSGGIVHNGSYTAPSYFVYNTTVTTGYTALPFSFSDAATYLTNQSSFWGSLTTNGTTTSSSGHLTLAGTNTSLDIFTVTAAQILSGISFDLSVPTGATALINVTGSTVNFQNFGFNVSGANDEHVLFNLVNATTVNISGVGIYGSLLAPNATVHFNNGNIDGTLVAGNLDGNGEAHLHLFQGDIYGPPPTVTPFTAAVPAPASAAGGIALLGGLLAARKLRSARLS